MSPNTDLNYFVFILAKLYCEMRHANYLDLCVSIFESQKSMWEKGPNHLLLSRDINRVSWFSRFLNGTFPWRNCCISPNKNIEPADWKNSIYVLRWNTAFNKVNNFSLSLLSVNSNISVRLYNSFTITTTFFSVVYCQINFLSRVRDTFSEYFLHKLMM